MSATTTTSSLPSIIRLSVGARIFRISTQTLRMAGGMLAQMFGDKHEEGMTKPQDDGVYFVDGDPESFEEIIRYLRTKSIYAFHKDTWPLTRTQIERYTGWDIPSLDLQVHGIEEDLLEDYCQRICKDYDKFRERAALLLRANLSENADDKDHALVFCAPSNHYEVVVRCEFLLTKDLTWEDYREIMFSFKAKNYRLTSLLECIRRLFKGDSIDLAEVWVESPDGLRKLKRQAVVVRYDCATLLDKGSAEV